MKDTGINTKHKDRLFSFIFGKEKNKKWTLELYNAVNHSDYKDPDDIEINTIEDFLYMGMKNDVSFLLHSSLNLYEHQSTYNPNMPVRQLIYIGQLYDKYIKQNSLNIYGSSRITIPVPKLVTFYNGTTDADDETDLNLSELFPDRENAESDVALRVRMLNINHGHNKELLEKCRPLFEYSWVVEQIRINRRNKLSIEDAVNKALDDMPDDFSIKAYLMEHRSEVNIMCLTEYDEAETMNMFKEEGRREGLELGLKEGEAERRRLEAEIEKLKKENEELRAMQNS